MIVLGFDTATPATAVGLRLADGTTLRARDQPTPEQRPGHTTRLLPLARELLSQADTSWEELGRIAVGVGPGTFTGLRIGVATARGLAQSLGVGVVGVSTLRVLAEAALRAQPEQGVLAVIDARRGEAFAAAYCAQRQSAPGQAFAGVTTLAGVTTEPKGRARALVGPRVLAPQELASIPTHTDVQRSWQAVGDGALRFREYLEATAVAVPADASPLHQVDAGVLCELALSAPVGDPEAVLPDYCRRPDAELALEAGGSGPSA